MNRSSKRKLIVALGVLLLNVLFSVASFAAGNMWLEQNRMFYPHIVRDGATQPVISMDADSWIYEEVWIESPTDSDRDGKRDLVRAGIRRPKLTVAAPNSTIPGLMCPVLVEASPYNDNNSSTYNSEYNFNVDGEYPGANNPSTMELQYSDVEFHGHTYKDLVAANFKPDWLPAERTSSGLSRDGTPVAANTVDQGATGSAAWMRYFLPRGYAFIRLNSLGSGKAEGLLPVGGYDESFSSAAVVDWLNGRVKAYTNQHDNIEVKAYWATGDVAMGGQSYNGSEPMKAALTGVEGLKTVVPSAPVYSWYEYYRANGLTYAPGGYQGEDVAEHMAYCFGGYNSRPYISYAPEVMDTYYATVLSHAILADRTTGSYSAFWDERNNTKYVGDLKASILLFHGLNDLNVKTKHAAMLWDAAKRNNVTMKIIYHLEPHATPWSRGGLEFLPKIHKWIDYHLYELDNGAMTDIPDVTIQNNNTLAYDTFSDWPISTKYQRLYPQGSDRVSTLSINRQKEPVNMSFVDEKAQTLIRPNRRGGLMANAQYLLWKNHIIGGTETPMTVSFDVSKITANGDRLMYLVDILEDTRIDGTIKMTAKVAADKNVGAISAMLVDFGDDRYVYRTFATSGRIINNSEITPLQIWAAGPNNAWPASNVNSGKNAKPAEFDPWNIIARGSVNVQKPNYNGKIWFDAADTNYTPEYYYQTENIEPGKFYPYTWELNVISYEIRKGHKLGLILYGTDPEYTQRPYDNPTAFTVEIGPETYLSLPVVDFVTNETPVIDEPQPITPETAFGGSANIPAGTSIASDVLVWNTEFTDEGDVLTGTALDGWTIYDFTPKSGDGWTASLADGKITVTFSKVVSNQEIQVYVSNANAALNDGILKVRFSGKATVVEPPKKPTDGSGGGCNAAYSVFALIALVPLAVRKRS